MIDFRFMMSSSSCVFNGASAAFMIWFTFEQVGVGIFLSQLMTLLAVFGFSVVF